MPFILAEITYVRPRKKEPEANNIPTLQALPTDPKIFRKKFIHCTTIKLWTRRTKMILTK